MAAERHLRREPIARGNTSDIWAWTEHAVIKVLRPEIPAHWARIEADILRRVHAAGLPVPATEGAIEVDGRTAIVLERVDGQSMWDRIKAEPATSSRLIEDLVSLQAEVHGTVVAGLPLLVERMSGKIAEAAPLPASERSSARRLLAALPDGRALCHGDFHPANIVLTRGGPVILDWFDAALGAATADFVRSSILMRPAATEPAWLPGAPPTLLDHVHCQYLATLVGRGLLEAETSAPWEAVVAAARLAEPVPAADLLAIWNAWRTDGDRTVRAMFEHCLGPSGHAAEAYIGMGG